MFLFTNLFTPLFFQTYSTFPHHLRPGSLEDLPLLLLPVSAESWLPASLNLKLHFTLGLKAEGKQNSAKTFSRKAGHVGSCLSRDQDLPESFGPSPKKIYPSRPGPPTPSRKQAIIEAIS